MIVHFHNFSGDRKGFLSVSKYPEKWIPESDEILNSIENTLQNCPSNIEYGNDENTLHVSYNSINEGSDCDVLHTAVTNWMIGLANPETQRSAYTDAERKQGIGFLGLTLTSFRACDIGAVKHQSYLLFPQINTKDKITFFGSSMGLYEEYRKPEIVMNDKRPDEILRWLTDMKECSE